MVPLLDFIRSAVKDMPSYKTVKKRAHDEFTEKRSRFIGYVCPVQTVEEANGFISEIKQKHWDAKHNVYAYILRDGNIKNIRMTASRRERQAYPYWTSSKKRRQRCLRCRNKVLRRHTFGRRRTRQSVFAYRKNSS